ncbi:hypothetical protein [Flavobacterium pallidum]|uniref:Lipocalin-like domain-containing protein n=1 Tax=Flavobacterium pallidum TaxID=2172098 RepID=A0A2S1SL26_9FLAO|nr:hypothetical protein [Flavobacterium pallidum]AWI27062.1 hypothetical protein HYN49_14765 [Flavobacterium pallidum]
MKPIFLFLLLIYNTANYSTTAANPGKKFMGEWEILSVSCMEWVDGNVYKNQTKVFATTTKITFVKDHIATVIATGDTIAVFPFTFQGGRQVKFDYKGKNDVLKSFNGEFKVNFTESKGKTSAILSNSKGCSIALER